MQLLQEEKSKQQHKTSDILINATEKQDKLFITKKERDSITLPELVV